MSKGKSKRSRFSIEVGLSAGSVYASLVDQAFWWFVRGANLESVETADSGKRHIVVNVHRYRDIKCHGQIQEWDYDKTDYVIDLNYEQDLRDFVATIMHELVHLQQYETGEWVDDGEGEADNRQYDLADEFWEQGLTLNV
jgi:hypothetical protein